MITDFANFVEFAKKFAFYLDRDSAESSWELSGTVLSQAGSCPGQSSVKADSR